MNRENLKEIYKKYSLEKDDIFILKFGSKEKPIITRSGIQKIQNKLGAQVNFKLEKISDDCRYAVVLATGVLFDGNENNPQPRPKIMIQSFGEASPKNCSNPYPVAMAEKRALARTILKLANLHGFYSEDEAEEFKNEK
tara:strand:- start:960 stop:1376 length:417 start_codon:yes stop_codon:yes gene_type:complete